MRGNDTDDGRREDTPAQHGPRSYEIRVTGHLASRWADWFDGMTLTPSSDGTTLIHGPVPDQAALHGLLRSLRDLGLPLISVTPAEGTETPEHGTNPK
jgi:hypothetical protein